MTAETVQKALQSVPYAAPEPIPLFADRVEEYPYPVDALGDVLGGAARALHEIVQVPLALASQSVLAAAALACQPFADVHLDGRVYPLSLFLLSVAESGERKSHTDKLALAEHAAFERRSFAEFARQRHRFESEQAAYQKAREAVLRSKRGQVEMTQALDALLPPVRPCEPRLVTDDVTFEGLVKGLVVGLPSMGLFSDEGGRFFGGHAMSKDNALKSIAGLSNLWDGKPIDRMRSGDGDSLRAYGRRLSCHLMIQPIVASSVLADPVLRGQGFLARFLVVWQSSLIGKRLYVADPEKADASKDARLLRYWERMGELLKRPLPRNKEGELTPEPLNLTPEARAIWIDFHDDIERACGDEGALFDVRATGAKAAEMCLRIAGVLAIAEGSRAISGDLLFRAVMIERFYLDEIMRLTERAGEDQRLVHAHRLLAWFRDKGVQAFTVRELMQNAPRACKIKGDAAHAQALLSLLLAHHWVETDDSRTWRVRHV